MPLSITEKKLLNNLSPGTRSAGLGDKIDAIVSGSVSAPDFTVGAENDNVAAVAVQLKDAEGANPTTRKFIQWWLSDTAGGAETGTGPATSTVISVGVSKKVTTAKIAGEALTSATGAITFTLTETGTATWYLNIAVEGKVYSSTAITFAA